MSRLRVPCHRRIEATRVARPSVVAEPTPTGEDILELTPDPVFRRYSGYVTQLAFKLLGRDGEVDDLVQDVFVQCIYRLPSLREPAAIKGWLATVTVRLAQRRLWRRRLRAVLGLDGSEVSDDEIAGPSTSPEDRETLQQVYQTLDKANAPNRIAWALRYMEGEPLEQVAILCGCSLATAKRRILAMRKAIEEALSDD